MKRGGPIPRHTPLRSGSGPSRGRRIKGKKRTPSAFARVYGSKARVEWVKAQSCVWCGKRPCDNAHVETGGMGRKADYTRIVPLCNDPLLGCHRLYDEHRVPFNKKANREAIQAHAAHVEWQWQEHLSRSKAA